LSLFLIGTLAVSLMALAVHPLNLVSVGASGAVTGWGSTRST
jgi:membrane associated rhomboid family serine protease